MTAMSGGIDPDFCVRAVLSAADARSDYGECRITSEHDPSGIWVRLRIDRADPRILISGKLAESWKECGGDFSPWNPFLTLRPGPGASPMITYGMEGWLVTLRGENRTVVYRIGKYLPAWDSHEAEWPD